MTDPEVGNAHTSRFARWGRAQAAGVLVGFIVLLLWGLIAGTNLPAHYHSSNPAVTNVGLYNAIVDKMMDGDSYYKAVDESQAARGFPTRPSSTVREPTLASVESWLGGSRPMFFVLVAFVGLVSVLMIVRLERVAPGRISWWLASMLSAVSALLFLNNEGAAFHEYWAGILVALALATLSSTRWRVSIFIAFMAVLVRELAFPLVAGMALYEFLAGRRRRAAAWVVAAIGFAVFLAVHAVRVQHDVAPAAYQSPGWIKFGGWPFFVDSVRYTSFLIALPVWVGAIAVPLALLGWLSRRGDFANRVTLLLGMYAIAFMFVGRPGNVYWGFLFVVVLMPGMAFAPSALTELWRKIARSEPVPSARESPNVD